MSDFYGLGYPTKHPTVQHFTEEAIVMADGFPRRGHTESLPITKQDRLAHKRVRKALEELRHNEWIDADELPTLKPLARVSWVPDETVEEWLDRYRQAKATGWKPFYIDYWIPRDGYEHAE